jgi:hypothetical protein
MFFHLVSNSSCQWYNNIKPDQIVIIINAKLHNAIIIFCIIVENKKFALSFELDQAVAIPGEISQVSIENHLLEMSPADSGEFS